jgi:hypothetical protein
MKRSFVLATLLVLGVAALSACSGAELQGRLSGRGLFTLSPSTPSGARSVSASDDLFVFDVNARTDVEIPMGDFMNFIAKTDGDIDPAAHGNPVYLRNGGDVVGEGFVVVLNDDEARFAVVMGEDIMVSAGDSEEFTLQMDTATLLTEDPSEDDLLEIRFRYSGDSLDSPAMLY